MRRPLTPLLDLAFLAFLVLSGPPAGAHDDPEQQLNELTHRLEQEPDSAALHLERAELHRFRRDWSAAAADLQETSRLDPSMAAVDLAMARLLLDADNPTAALDAADRFLERSPGNVGGHLARARILLRSGRGLEAARSFTRAIDLDRELRGAATSTSPPEAGSGIQPDDYLQRAHALAESGRSDEAVRGLDEGLADLGQPVTLQLLAIEIEERRGHTDDALRRVASLEARAQRKEAWIARRGDILARAGRGQEAVSAWQDALGSIASLPARLRGSDATADLEAMLRRKIETAGTTSAAAPSAAIATAPTVIARTGSKGGTQ